MHNIFNKNIFKNQFLINKYPLYRFNFIAIIPLIKSFSTNILKNSVNNPESLAIKHINSGKFITHSIINKILLNQNLSITNNKLEELLKVKGIEIDLPVVTLEGNKLLTELTGKSKYKGFFGVYIFIHKKTNQKYVEFGCPIVSSLLYRHIIYALYLRLIVDNTIKI